MRFCLEEFPPPLSVWDRLVIKLYHSLGPSFLLFCIKQFLKTERSEIGITRMKVVIMAMKVAITCMLSLLLQWKARIFVNINSYDCILLTKNSQAA